MSAEVVGKLAGALVIASCLPYSIRTWQRKNDPKLVSWLLWTFIAFALMLTYNSSGAEDNLWPAVFGFMSPLVITILILVRQSRKLTKPDWLETSCLVLGILSLAIWWHVRQDKELAQYALYLAIIADLCAGIPTIRFVWTEPSGDRPLAWCLFALGYGLAIFAIPDHTIANYVLPLYMLAGASSIAFPLVRYRWKRRDPLSEWW